MATAPKQKMVEKMSDKNLMKSNETKQETARRLNNQYQADKRNGGLHKTVQKAMTTELGLGEGVVAAAILKYPGQVYGQIDYVYDNQQFIALTGRKRLIGETSLQNYRERTKTFYRMKEKLNMRSTCISDITARQVRAVFEQMKLDGKSESYIVSMNTTMRRFGLWLGKPDLCPPCKFLFEDKDVYTRKIAATERKDWGDDQDLIEEIIQDVTKDCEVVGCILRLAWNFGLRVKEGIMMRPAESIRGNWLSVKRGTKGGRARLVPIETQDQRSVLAWALEIASRSKEGLMLHKKGITLDQAMSHFEWIMRKNDLTRKGQGKTAHGLRHQFANDQYEFKTKKASPVRGGGQVEPELLVGAQKEISEMLGHSRTSITSAYTGNHRHLTRVAKANMEKLINKLEGDEKLKGLTKELGAEGVFVCGGHADGDAVKPDAMVLMSVEIGQKSIPHDVATRFTQRAQQILGCKLVVLGNNDALSVNASRLELFGLTGGGNTGASIRAAMLSEQRLE